MEKAERVYVDIGTTRVPAVTKKQIAAAERAYQAQVKAAALEAEADRRPGPAP